MRRFRFMVASIGFAASLGAVSSARSAELYLAGDLGISWFSGSGKGTNDIVAMTNSGTSEDATPVYGGALGVVFPLNAALPWPMRLPGFGVPYWPGREVRFEGGDDVRFPDWEVRAEVEHLRGRNADLVTPSFNPLDAYRSNAKSWTLMGKLRLDVPLRAPAHALFGRAPFLEPFSLYGGGGAGMSNTEFAVSTGLLVGSHETEQFSWQANAGIGYQLNEHVKLSIGWRYLDIGKVKTQLVDSTFTNRGRYSMNLDAHEFTASLSVWFWRLPPLLGTE
jgi:Outer membrane protein beta-barrel domain